MRHAYALVNNVIYVAIQTLLGEDNVASCWVLLMKSSDQELNLH